MRHLKKRLEKLEEGANIEDRHLVMWGWGQPFTDALKRSFRPKGKHKRLLIELRPMIGGHGKPIVPAWEPEYQDDYDAAHAWASQEAA